MAISFFAGLGRLLEITIPVADIGGVPFGLSLVAGNYQDEFLLNAAKQFFGDVGESGRSFGATQRCQYL